MFVASASCLLFSYGLVVGKYRLFPYYLLEPATEAATDGYRALRTMMNPDYQAPHRRIVNRNQISVPEADEAYRGVNLVTRIASDQRLVAEVINMDGQSIHEWHIDWFSIWPDAEHLPKDARPRTKPGTHIHGAVVMEEGDLILNFEHLGLVRLGRDSKVVWRLPYQTHHSIHRHDDGNLLVCGQRHHAESSARFPNRIVPFAEYTILEVTPGGRIVEEWSVAELLHENGLAGLLFLGSLENESTQVHGDVLHLNDVEPFPATMKEGFFSQGDVLVSLRNINTVFVFNRHSRKIRYHSTGWFVRQHDPDFIDGDRFSVFDNNNIAPEGHGQQSRIVMVSARDNTLEVVFEGSLDAPFYTDIMGKHQWLPNGNLLITESRQGRAFEINPQGEVVWEYMNYVDRRVVDLVEEVQRLPPEYERLFSRIESNDS